MNKLGIVGVFVGGMAIGVAVSFVVHETDREMDELHKANTGKIAPEVLEYHYSDGSVKLREEWVGRNWGEPTHEGNGLVGYTIDEDYEAGTLLRREWFTPDGHLMARTDYECDECEYGFFFDDNGALKAAMIFKDDLAYGPAMRFDPPVKPTSIVYYNDEGAKERELVLNEKGEYVEAITG